MLLPIYRDEFIEYLINEIKELKTDVIEADIVERQEYLKGWHDAHLEILRMVRDVEV